jgi:hypothetical protein
VRVDGVHPIKANEPVQLIEVHIAPDEANLDWASVTQR